MIRNLILTLLFFNSVSHAQNSLIHIDETVKDIGNQENIYKIKVDYVIINNQAKKLFLLRADAKKGIIIKTSKKTILPNDTCLISVEFIPERTGKFKEDINLITSADGLPFIFSVTGNIKSIKTDDKTACYYFGKPNNNGVKITEAIVVPENNTPRDVSNKIPDNSSTPRIKEPELHKGNSEEVTQTESTELDERKYKANNLIFLIDVSSSMKDSSKLQVMQQALYYLIDNLRQIDKVSIITYADSVKVLKNGFSGTHKIELNEVVNKLKARGLTKGRKAILFSLDFAINNYIENGNNQIILITDGKFNFYPDDQKLYQTKQGNKIVKLSTVALGNDKEALKNLKEIAKIGKGNFIHINKRYAKLQLLEEIKNNSLMP